MSSNRRPAVCDARWVGIMTIAFAAVSPLHAADPQDNPFIIKVKNKASLVHLGSLDSFDKTPSGIKAAKLIIECLEQKRLDAAREALKIYEEIVPKENFGGEYTTLQWVCEYLIASPDEQKTMLADRFVARFHQSLAEDNYLGLRNYLRMKYHLDDKKDEKKDDNKNSKPDEAANKRQRYFEDSVLFSNPRRERWEKSSKIVEAVKLKKGDVVADVGCGQGYFTFKFADIVGPTGKIYAIDTNEMHIDYQTKLIKDFGITNVDPLKPSVRGVGLPEGTKLDCAFMCSLYHILYCSWLEEERTAFLTSIKSSLKPDGRLIIVDNGLVDDRTLPYHGPYIAKELVVAQLEHSGFRLVETHQVIPQRYVLIFKLADKNERPREAPSTIPEGCIYVPTASSLVTGPGPKFTKGGRKAARDVYQALDKNDKDAARAALAQYKELLPKESVGNDYLALSWYCEYVIASPDERKKLLQDRWTALYFESLGGDDFSFLKKYVKNQYLLDKADKDIEDASGSYDPGKLNPTEVDELELRGWNEIVVFSHPLREKWENTSQMLGFLKIKPGDVVADVGSGPGYFTFKFSELVGKQGRALALDTGDEGLDKIRAAIKKYDLTNIEPRKSLPNNTQLAPASVDVVFLCSLFHAIYLTDLEFVQEEFILSIKRGLKKGGRLVIADNEVLKEGRPVYYGPRIDRQLIIEQLKRYGFRLVDSAQFIPQRYILVFQSD
jgi:ubiquinone/menaquinone biosynthesis C-methylase UbiE